MKSYIVASIIILVLAVVSGFSADILTAAEAPRWAGMILEMFSYLCYVALGLIILAGLWKFRKLLFGFLAEGEPIKKPEPVETENINQAMDNLAMLLAQLQPSIEEADSRLLDAKMWTETLVNQILAVVSKVEAMERLSANLSQALEAVSTGDRAKAAYCAGKINDQTIKSLLLSPYLGRETFKTEAAILISNEIGSLEEWSQGYERLATSLFSQVSLARNRMLALEQARGMLEASHPIMLIEQNLGKAQDALRLKARPSLRFTARQALPAGVNAHLLD